ncbi:MAG: PAS domain S-box protein [Syntrophus sp. (in: bacteria)]
MEDAKKTKKQLIEELKDLRLRSAAPEKVAFPESKHMDGEVQQQLHKLAERVKELDCLYGISNLIETPEISTEGILRGTVELLSRAWQYPDLSCARIVLKDQTYETKNFQESAWRLASNISVQGEPIGMVEVLYLKEPPTDGQAPFLPEEIKLLNAVAESLGRVTDRKQAEEALRERDERYREFFATSRDCVFISSPDGRLIDFNDATLEMFGYDNRDKISDVTIPSLYANPEDRSVFLNLIVRDGYVKEFPVQLKRRDGTVIDTLITGVPLRNHDGTIRVLIGTARDITDRKRADRGLAAREKELENRTAELEEANTALRVILRRREEDQKIMEEKIQANVNELIMPLVRKLKQTYLNGQSVNVVNLLEDNIGNITAPFINHLSTAHKTMTPKEIQVAALIRQGNKSKEIAAIIGVSIGTVNTHRDNIRKKLHLKSKDVNLHAHLLSLA